MRVLVIAVTLGMLLPTDGFSGWMDDEGANLSGIVGGADRPATAPSARIRGNVVQVAGPAYEYRVISDCAAGSLDDPDGTVTCYSAARACELTGGPGPQASVYRRTSGATEWTYVGKTCFPDQYQPPAPAVPTLGEIQRAFDTTPFAVPVGSTQPPDGHTLIGFPTYFTLTWPAQGYRPGQTRTLTLLGHQLELRLRHGGHTYVFGDGTTLGPTTDPGGPYPTGAITHPYASAGTYAPTATTTITADYRVDAGPWQTLPGRATQTTAFPALTVHTATNRLRPNPS